MSSLRDRDARRAQIETTGRRLAGLLPDRRGGSGYPVPKGDRHLGKPRRGVLFRASGPAEVEQR